MKPLLALAFAALLALPVKAQTAPSNADVRVALVKHWHGDKARMQELKAMDIDIQERDTATVEGTLYTAVRASYLPNDGMQGNALIGSGLLVILKRGPKGWLIQDAVDASWASMYGFDGGRLLFTEAEHAPDDARCCPSIQHKRKLVWADGHFVRAD